MPDIEYFYSAHSAYAYIGSALLKRIAETHTLTPANQIAIIALAPDGRWCGGALRPGFRIAVTSADQNEAVQPTVVLEPDS